MDSDSETDETSQNEQSAASEQREQGIDMGDLHDDLENYDYPATTAELVDDFGDREIELPNGSETFGEVMGGIEGEGQEYQDADDVQSMVKNMVGDEAVGREGYSDRGGSVKEVSGDESDEISGGESGEGDESDEGDESL